MNNRTVKRGASARFLALLASFTMLLAGLVGVVSAGSASAYPQTNDFSNYLTQADCESALGVWTPAVDADDPSTEGKCSSPDLSTLSKEKCLLLPFAKWVGSDDKGQCKDQNSPGSSGEHKVTICHRTASLTNPYVVETVDLDSIGAVKKFSTADEKDGHDSHTGPIFDPAVNLAGNGNVKWGDIIPPFSWDAIINGGGGEQLAAGSYDGKNWDDAGKEILKNGCKIPDYEPQTRSVYWCDGEGTQVSNDGFETWAWAEDSATPPEGEEWYTDEEDVRCPVDPVYAASITCSAWSASVNLPAVVIDDELSEENLGDRAVEKTGVVEVFIDGNLVETGQLDENGDWTGGDTITPPFQDGATHKLVIKVDGEEVDSATSGVCSPPPDFCTLNPGSVSCNPPATCANNPAACPPESTPPVTTPVVEAAVVAAPAQAAAAPAPANVAIPAKATLPAAVPAGDGSQSPGLPLWAAALMLVGLLGAAASAKGLFARK